jgi:hypothetical protein
MGTFVDVYAVQPKNMVEAVGRPNLSGVPIEEDLGSGRYRVSINGQPFDVAGPVGLKQGERVRVSWEKQPQSFPTSRPEDAAVLVQETVWLPLAFGGEKASLRVEVFVPNAKKKVGSTVAVFFLVETDTAHVGKTQWGIHLRDRRLALQLYLENDAEPVLAGDWVSGVVDRLTALGFEMEHPLQRLKRPLHAPKGYGVSVRG